MNKNNLQTLKGFRDFLPADAIKRNYLKNKISQVFESWGFDPLETPTLEALELFAGQIGEDEKLFYRFTDNGGREVALRYDQTVPICRVVSQYRGIVPFPFRRYQIQSVFRAEKPQKGRYREFVQCDADIFGVKDASADAEVIALGLDIFRQLGFPQAKALISDRSLLKGIPYEAIVAIDKIKKIGRDGVIEDMVKKDIPLDQAQAYLAQLENLQPNDTLKTIFSALKNYGFDESWYEFDKSIARSFSYSDGPIWEISIPGYTAGSVLGGERYDGLVEKIAGVNIPGTGFGLGFDRTLEAAEQFGLLPNNETIVDVLMASYSPVTQATAIQVNQQLRQAGLKVELYPAFDKLGKQFKFADRKKINWVIVIGEDEQSKGVLNLKNMQSGEQQLLTVADAIALIKKS